MNRKVKRKSFYAFNENYQSVYIPIEELLADADNITKGRYHIKYVKEPLFKNNFWTASVEVSMFFPEHNCYITRPGAASVPVNINSEGLHAGHHQIVTTPGIVLAVAIKNAFQKFGKRYRVGKMMDEATNQNNIINA